jgi:LacI family transcriptional regulator
MPRPPARAGIQDVAREAGVSAATVSNVVNRPEVVAGPTRLRVEEAILAVGYVPDVAARLMRGGASSVVGCVLLNIADPFYAEICRGIEDALRPLGLLTLIGSTDVDPDREREYLGLMRAQRVRGVILNPTDPGLAAVAAGGGSEPPIVLIDRPRGDLDVCAVTGDHELGGYLLARHLIEIGHRRLTLVWPPRDVESIHLRESGIRRAVAEAGPEYHDAVRLVRPEPGPGADFEVEALVTRLMGDDEPPTALVCFNDSCAVRVMDHLRRLDLRVPEQVSVTGYDDLDSSPLLSPALTTVRQPARGIGLLAARLVLREGDTGHRHEERVLRVDLVVRESTAPPGG